MLQRTSKGEFATPEAIDDSPQLAPSKRIEALMPLYRKPLMGPAAQRIRLATIRKECLHFGDWLERLERLA